MKTRNEVVKLAESWVGKNEKDGSFKEIIDIYNSYTGPLPRGIKMAYSWAWCACTWSALAIKLGYTDIMPIEISCGFLIDEAKKMGCWIETDNHIPKIGEACLYDWQDTGIGDNAGWPDHVGVVTYVNESAGYFVVTEGNYSDSVKKRTVSINGKFIRGFISPNYDEIVDLDPIDIFNRPIQPIDTIAREVIAGMWGNGEDRKKKLSEAGYSYDTVQKKVNEILNCNLKTTANKTNIGKEISKSITTTCYAKSLDNSLSGIYKTTDDLYCRNDAGTNKKALCLIPKGTDVRCYGFYTSVGNVKWYLIEVRMDSVMYTGFSCSKYLEKV